MIGSFLSSITPSNSASRSTSVSNVASDGGSRNSINVENGIRRVHTAESSLSSSPSISHPLLRNQWGPTRSASASRIVSPATSPLVRSYPSVSSSSAIMDMDESSERDVVSIFSLD